MYQMKRFIDMERPTLSCFCSYQVGLHSVSYTANEYSIYRFCIMIKELSISFSRVIIVKDFKAVTFNVLFVYKPTICVIFCWMKRVHVSSQSNGHFILYISTARRLVL